LWPIYWLSLVFNNFSPSRPILEHNFKKGHDRLF
jgi:hypothetical protein